MRRDSSASCGRFLTKRLTGSDHGGVSASIRAEPSTSHGVLVFGYESSFVFAASANSQGLTVGTGDPRGEWKVTKSAGSPHRGTGSTRATNPARGQRKPAWPRTSKRRELGRLRHGSRRCLHCRSPRLLLLAPVAVQRRRYRTHAAPSSCDGGALQAPRSWRSAATDAFSSARSRASTSLRRVAQGFDVRLACVCARGSHSRWDHRHGRALRIRSRAFRAQCSNSRTIFRPSMPVSERLSLDSPPGGGVRGFCRPGWWSE
jgi:hypothetical protein